MAKAKPEPILTKKDLAAADKVVRKMTGTNFPAKTKVSKLPSVGEVFSTDQESREAMTVLERGHTLKDQVDALNEELKEVKDEATAIAMGASIDGFRFGDLAVSVTLTQGRMTLDKDLLRAQMVDYGVDPTEVSRIIEDSHKQGEPFYTVKFEKVTK